MQAALPAHKPAFPPPRDNTVGMGDDFQPTAGETIDGNTCHGCQMFRRHCTLPCRMDSNLTRFAPCSLWEPGAQYAFPVNIVWTTTPVTGNEVRARRAQYAVCAPRLCHPA